MVPILFLIILTTLLRITILNIFQKYEKAQKDDQSLEKKEFDNIKNITTTTITYFPILSIVFGTLAQAIKLGLILGFSYQTFQYFSYSNLINDSLIIFGYLGSAIIFAFLVGIIYDIITQLIKKNISQQKEILKNLGNIFKSKETRVAGAFTLVVTTSIFLYIDDIKQHTYELEYSEEKTNIICYQNDRYILYDNKSGKNKKECTKENISIIPTNQFTGNIKSIGSKE